MSPVKITTYGFLQPFLQIKNILSCLGRNGEAVLVEAKCCCRRQSLLPPPQRNPHVSQAASPWCQGEQSESGGAIGDGRLTGMIFGCLLRKHRTSIRSCWWTSDPEAPIHLHIKPLAHFWLTVSIADWNKLASSKLVVWRWRWRLHLVLVACKVLSTSLSPGIVAPAEKHVTEISLH